MSDIVFAKGIYVQERSKNQPDFVLFRLSLKREEVIEWLKTMDDEYVAVDGLMSKQGKPYCVLNTYKRGETKTESKPAPKADPAEKIEYPSEEINPDDIPF